MGPTMWSMLLLLSSPPLSDGGAPPDAGIAQTAKPKPNGLGTAALVEGPDGALDFTAEAKLLYRVVACGSDAALPAAIDAAVVAAHCKELERRIALYRATWVKEAMPFLASLTPPGLPKTVVYPFGGGDLVSALTTWPEAAEFTTLSLEHAGDPRRIHGLDGRALATSLALIRQTSAGLLVANDSKTENLMKGQRGELPGQLSFFLIGLAVHGYEPVKLRYLKVNPDGSLRGVTRADLESLEKSNAKLLKREWVSPDFSEAFSNLELTFVKKGSDPKAARVHRHFAINLDDEHFGKDEAMKQYLARRGPIVAMTKAASYLLWRDTFSSIRGYLLDHMELMFSDSTGIPPRFAKPAGFSQQAYGRFAQSFLNANREHNDDFRALWQSAKPLTFRYGYLDKNLSKHLLITRRVRQSPDAGRP